MTLKNRKLLGARNQKQGTDSEIFVMKKLQKNGWTVIPTKGSKSPLDIIAYHKKKKIWWGVQVKSTAGKMTFDIDAVADICHDLHFIPVLAYVKSKKPREAHFCLKKQRKLYHVFEDGESYHPLGEDWDCVAFKAKISVG